MAFRLRGSLDDRMLAYDLRTGRNVVGSAPTCDLRLTDPTISRSHAELRVDGDRVELYDLGSRNGTFVDGTRIARELLPGSAEIAFGRVKLLLEEVQSGDLEMGAVLASGRPGAAGRAEGPAEPPAAAAPPAPPEVAERAATTVGTQALNFFTRGHLPGLLQLLGEGADVSRVAQAGGMALFDTLPVLNVEVTAGPLGRGGAPGGEATGVLFAARRGVSAAPPGARPAADLNVRPLPRPADAALAVPCGDGDLAVRVAFPSDDTAGLFRPLVATVAALIGLAASRPQPAPDAAAPAAAPALPEPPSVVPAVQCIFAEAARVAAGDVGALIRGESGTGKEVRSLADSLADCERNAILQALNVHGGDVVVAAGALRIGRSTLYRRMRALGVEAERGAGHRAAGSS
jgi:hypothetical protein